MDFVVTCWTLSIPQSCVAQSRTRRCAGACKCNIGWNHEVLAKRSISSCRCARSTARAYPDSPCLASVVVLAFWRPALRCCSLLRRLSSRLGRCPWHCVPLHRLWCPSSRSTSPIASGVTKYLFSEFIVDVATPQSFCQ